MQSLNLILRNMIDAGAESVQLRPGYPPHFLRDGQEAITGKILIDGSTLGRFAEHVLAPAQAQTLVKAGRVSGQHTIAGLGVFDFRVKRTQGGVALAFRLEDGMSDAVDLSMSMDASYLSALSTAEITGEHAPSDKGASDLPTGFVVQDRTLTGILRTVLKYQVSDLVVSSGRPARVRIGGQYRSIPWAVFDSAAIMSVLQPALNADRHSTYEAQGNLDLAFEVKDDAGVLRRFRVNLFRHLDGIATAWRPIWDTVPSFEQLRLPEQLLELAEVPYGLVLITGPTGSGKSTTLSAIIEYINQTQKSHIITLEDPIEYRFRDRQAVIHQREVGIHVDSFSTGLRSALREAPDVILVGEMRDQDTISAALTAAETGHLVLSTLHSGHSAQAIDRVIDVFPEHQQQQVRIQLSDVLRAVVTQRLLPTLDGEQRVPAVELVRVTYAVSNTIREGRTHQLNNLIQSGSKNGMIPFDMSLAELVNEGLIDARVAARCARDRSFFDSLSGAKSTGN